MQKVDKDLICQLVEEADTAVYVVDYETDKLIYINHAVEEMMGKSREDMNNKTCYEFLMNREKPCSFCRTENLSCDKFHENMVEQTSEKKLYSIRRKLISWNGRKCHVHYATEATNEVTLGNIACGVCVYTVNQENTLNICYANAGYYEICEGSYEEVEKACKEDYWFGVYGEHRKNLQNFFAEIIKNHKANEVTYQYRTLKGNTKWIRAKASFTVGNPGQRDKIYCTFFDVSEEHTNGVMRENLLNALPGGVVIYKMGKSIETLYFNDGVTKLTGHTHEEYAKLAKENPVDFFVLEEERSEIRNKIYEASRTGSPLSLTYRIYHKTGSLIWVQLTAIKIEEEEGVPIYYAIYTKPTEEAVQFEELVNGSVNGVVVLEQDTKRILYLNEASMALTGIYRTKATHYQLIGKRIPEYQKMIPEEEYSEIKEGSFKEFHLMNEKGKYLLVKGKRITWCGQQALLFYMMDETAEVKERRRVERLLNQIPTGITILDVIQGKVYQSYVNDGFYRMIGAVRGERKHYNGFATINANCPEDLPIILDAVQKVIDGEDQIHITYRLIDGKGDYIWLNMAGRVVERTRERIRVYCGFSNVDALKKTQMELLRNRTILDMAMDNAKIEVWSLDMQEKKFKIMNSGYNNPVDIGILEDLPEYLIKKGIIHPSSADTARELYRRVYAGEKACGELKLREKHGEYQWKRIIYTPVYDMKGKLIEAVGTGINITDEIWKKQLETSLQEANQANRAKSEFLSRVSHDMRTPLNGILGLTQIMKEKKNNREFLMEIEQLELSGQYLLNLINDTLDVSKIESGKMELHPVVCDGKKIFEGSLALIKPNLEAKKINFVMDIVQLPFTMLYIDIGRVEQMIMNVLSNAIKFTSEKGNIFFSMKNIAEDQEYITDEMRIRDDGIGISPEFLPHIFEPFSQENTARTSIYRGTGLGMVIAKQIVEMMGGHISVTSELGKGTEFCIVIKFKKATASQIREYQQKKSKPRISMELLQGKHVLLCEDHPLNARISARILERAGMMVDHAINGKAGVELFAESQENYYDIVLMDIRMPVMDGLDAARAIRRLERKDARSVPIIALTANVYEEDREMSKAAGMNGHFSKPIDAVLLYEEIRRHLSENAREAKVEQRDRVTEEQESESERNCILQGNRNWHGTVTKIGGFMIKVENLSYGYPQKDLYKKVSFTIEKDVHCVLIGTNGTGKSTLIDLLMNEEDYLYDGKIQMDGVDRIGYVSQFSPQNQKEDLTVFQYISQEFVKQEQTIADLCKEMETAEDLEKIFETYQQALDEFHSMDGDFYESNIKKQLKTANLQKAEEQSLSSLSAGEFKLVQIIKEMIQKPDLLIMDEPDVFLDFEHLNALRNLINTHKGTMLVITHNRYLLNHCFNKILQLENTDMQEFDGTYIEYNYELLGTKLELKEIEAKEQEEIDRQTEILTKARVRAQMFDNPSLGRTVHARQTLVDRLKARKTKAPFVQIKQPEIHFESGSEVKEEHILTLTDYSVAFDEQLLEHVNVQLKPADHVAIVGNNGTGKTTLLRDIFENKNETIKISEEAEIQMFSQFTSVLEDGKTVLEVLEEKGFEKKQEVVDYLEKYGFDQETISQNIGELSGGERDLLQLAVISLEKANLLLLDEPTGHLDVYGQIALEEAIAEYPGAVLMVSHDFYTVANCVDYVLFVENNTVRRMSTRKFRQMIYANHFSKDYLLLEQEKKEIELRIGKMIQKNEFEKAKAFMESLGEIIRKIKGE